MKELFVPLTTSSVESDCVRVPFSKDQVTHEPDVKVRDDQIDEESEQRLYDYFGLPYSYESSATGLAEGPTPARASRDFRMGPLRPAAVPPVDRQRAQLTAD